MVHGEVSASSTVVIDCGSLTTRAGLANGNALPRKGERFNTCSPMLSASEAAFVPSCPLNKASLSIGMQCIRIGNTGEQLEILPHSLPEQFLVKEKATMVKVVQM
jgi:hypothetical protein